MNPVRSSGPAASLFEHCPLDGLPFPPRSDARTTMSPRRPTLDDFIAGHCRTCGAPVALTFPEDCFRSIARVNLVLMVPRCIRLDHFGFTPASIRARPSCTKVEPPIRDNSPDLTLRTSDQSAVVALVDVGLPDAKSLAHIPERRSPIDARIVRLAAVMGLPASQIESDIHAVIALATRKGRQMSLDMAIKCYGEAQAFFDGMHGREWPTDCPDCTSFGKCRYCGGSGEQEKEDGERVECNWCGGDGKCPNECERSKS